MTSTNAFFEDSFLHKTHIFGRCSFNTVDRKQILPMTWFELMISDVGSDRSITTTTTRT